MERLAVVLFSLLLGVSTFAQEAKQRTLNIGVGISVNTISGPEGINVTTPAIKTVFPITKRLDLVTDYTIFLNAFNTSKTLRGFSTKLNAQFILIDLEMLQLYATGGYSFVDFRQHGELGNAVAQGVNFGIGFKSKMKKLHIFYEGRKTYNRASRYDAFASNDVSMGAYKEIEVKLPEKNKRSKVKKVKHHPFKIKMEACPEVH